MLPQSLGFTPKSISFSVLKDLPSWMVASATVQRIERAPTALELFAHGAHDAPGTFEIGNPGLKIETANTAEIGLKRTRGSVPLRRQGLLHPLRQLHLPAGDRHSLRRRISRPAATGTEFLQTVYSQRDAIFRGGEIAWQWDLIPVATGIFGVDGQYDFVRATFTDGSNVPRMPPMRVGGGTFWRNDNWFVRMGLLHAFGQNDLGSNETPTAGYNLLKMEISNKQYWKYSPWGPTEITTGLVGDNLLDVDIRNSVQFHKDEILLPGRSIKFFFNAKFGGAPPVTRPGAIYKAPTGFAAPTYRPLIGRHGPGPASMSAPTSATAPASPTPTRSSTIPRPERPAVRDQRLAQLDGAIGGVQAGYNWVAGNLLAGVEADLNYSGQRARLASTCPGESAIRLSSACRRPVGAGDLRAGPETGMVRDIARAARHDRHAGCPGLCHRRPGGGRDHDRRHGVRLRRRRQSAVNTIVSSHNTKAGWTVGGGIEGRLVGNWTASSNTSISISASVPTVPAPAPERDGRGCLQFPRHGQRRARSASTTSSIPMRSGQTTDRQ